MIGDTAPFLIALALIVALLLVVHDLDGKTSTCCGAFLNCKDCPWRSK